ncbi:MAG: hypothetical protein HY717_03005 [Planctomycetes bacterium]|nr:hypothetical protein [Planctomycetota bacterium]
MSPGSVPELCLKRFTALMRIEGIDEDFDLDRRDAHPDAGADELRK